MRWRTRPEAGSYGRGMLTGWDAGSFTLVS